MASLTSTRHRRTQVPHPEALNASGPKWTSASLSRNGTSSRDGGRPRRRHAPSATPPSSSSRKDHGAGIQSRTRYASPASGNNGAGGANNAHKHRARPIRHLRPSRPSNRSRTHRSPPFTQTAPGNPALGDAAETAPPHLTAPSPAHLHRDWRITFSPKGSGAKPASPAAELHRAIAWCTSAARSATCTCRTSLY